VIVAGSSYASGNADWKIIAYAGADGTVLCQRSYAGAANGRDEAYAVVARASGTFVAGTAVESGTTTTVRVEKLAPASASSTGPATLASPAPGSALAGSTVTFTWNDAGAALYQLWVGNSTGAYDIGYYPASGTKQTSTTVTGLPADGRKLYVRLYSNIGGTYVYRDFTYTAAGAVAAPSAPTTAALTSPAPGGTLAGSSVTFQWDNSGASLYQLWIGNSAGGFDVGYYPASGTTQDSIAVTGLPTDGRKLYARLYSAINGAWQYRDFTYTAAGSAGAAPGAPGPASIVSPAAGSTLQGATPVFQWNDAGAQLYQVWVGSSVGADDYGYFPASGTTSTMATATALPIDGRTLYVRLYSAINGAWQFRDFTYRSGP
jgi:hypothetical protein